MSNFMSFLVRTFDRVLNFVLRRRSVAAWLTRWGAVVSIAALASGWALGIFYRDGTRVLQINVQTTDGVPAWALLTALAVGLGTLVVGAVMGSMDWRREVNAENRRKSVIVELRGLHSSPDTPASAASLGLPKGRVDLQRVDFRPPSERQLVDPELALEMIEAVKRSVEMACSGVPKEDVTVALGGLAAVPCLFLIGMLFDDETKVIVYDWDRGLKAWRLTDGQDDGKRMQPLAMPADANGAKEVLMAVSVSYCVDEQAVARVFEARMPIIHLRSEVILADRYWSEVKQRELVVAFRDAVQLLMTLGVGRIHLVLAAPASLTIRMGMAYDRRLMPELVVYQYERTSTTPYPWGIQMPTHGRRSATLERMASN